MDKDGFLEVLKKSGLYERLDRLEEESKELKAKTEDIKNKIDALKDLKKGGPG